MYWKITIVFSFHKFRSVLIGLWEGRSEESFKRDWFNHVRYKSSGDLLSSIVHIVNDTVLTVHLKFVKRVNSM